VLVSPYWPIDRRAVLIFHDSETLPPNVIGSASLLAMA
jgi:hypothetical protein